MQTRVNGIGEKRLPVGLILAHIILWTFRGFHLEAFQIRVILIVSIEYYRCPYFVRIPLFNRADIAFKVIIEVEIGRVEVAIIQYNEYAVAIVEFA